MFQGGFLLCAVLAAVVVADVRQFHQGPLAALLSIRPVRWVGSISYGIYLWHWPIFVFFTQARTGLGEPWLDLARVALTLVVATASYYLVERPFRRRLLVGRLRFTLAPAVAAVTAAVVVVATIPAVAAPPSRAPSARPASVGGTVAVPGAGGIIGRRIALPPFGPADPLRVTVFGDSVAEVAEPGIAAALGATGEVTVRSDALGGFGLNVDQSWDSPTTGIASSIAYNHTQLVLATWSWDDSCTPGRPSSIVKYVTYTCALQRPKAYTVMLEKAIRLMLTPGGASGVIFLQFPRTGPDQESSETATSPALAADLAGERAWNAIVESMPALFPGKVMYLPIGSSVLLDGKYFSPWLPPEGDPSAPKSQWVRVRMTDGVHLCPAGAARYADAVLADLTDLYDLRPASAGWSTQSWTDDPLYNTPPGVCPDDHPS